LEKNADVMSAKTGAAKTSPKSENKNLEEINKKYFEQVKLMLIISCL
jgi:hypothetical protein